MIGCNNELPWHLPEDLRHFKRITMGRPIIMGRKTFDSIGRALPGRRNIVISKQPDFAPADVQVASSPEQAVELANGQPVDEVMVIGGEAIYRALLGVAHRLYLTEVHISVEGDAYFPDYKRSEWREDSRERFKAQSPESFDYSFVLLERHSGSGS